jgi:sugar lactone lactonase YvrE
MTEVTVVVEAKNLLGEGPVWSTRDQVLWWVDIIGRQILRLDPATGSLDRWPTEMRPCCLAEHEAGGLVVAFDKGFGLFDPESAAVTWIADSEKDNPRTRINDGKVDRRGRFVVGTLDDKLKEHLGALYRLDPDGTVTELDAGFGISNGPAWSPDDRRFYFGDSMDKAIYAYDYDAASGTVANKRVFATIDDGPGIPDGATVDAEGCLWNAQWDAWRVVRYRPDGTIDRTIRMPVSRPTSCMFGGPDLTTLYVTSAIWDPADPRLVDEPLAGSLFAIDVGVRGLPEPRFAG